MSASSTAVDKELSSSLQVMSDAWLAWQLQAEEYKKTYQLPFSNILSVFASPQNSTSPLYQFQNTRGEIVSFNLRPTSINGDCFFDAVNRAGFTRDALVKKLLNNPTGSVRAVFAHEIRQFLYLGYTGSHPNKQENQACQQLLTPRIGQLFFALQEAEAALRPMVDAVRSELGARETHQKKPPELLGLLRQRDSRLTQKFEQAYQAVLNADKAIYEYCCETEVFKNYVVLYLKEARGYIPFSRDFGRGVPITTIDIINQLFGLKIQVYLPHNRAGRQLQIANQLQTGEIIPIFHNGINHFWGLVLSANPSNAQVDSKEDNDSTPHYQSSNTSGEVSIHLRPLPNIPYNRGDLNEIIEEIPMGSDIQAKVSSYLENIEKQVSDIQKYQAKNKLENFYASMRVATNEIRNTAKTLYELTKDYHLSLANTLKEQLLKWIIPLEAALERRLEMPVDDREALVLKTKHLYAEQSFISRQIPLQQALMQHLEKVKGLLLESGRPNPRCYISYAWPSQENKAQEYWVQPFLTVLYDHLTAVGIRVIMDIRDNKPGDSIYRFMKQYHEGNYIILIGTESLLQKHYSVTPHAVQTELSIILNRFEQDQKQFGQSRIYPLLISGTLKSAYPERYQLYSTVRDARDQGYLGTLKKLTDWIYENRVNTAQQQHANLWRTFNEACPGLPKESKVIEQEIAIGYHRQRLDYLRQDPQYRTVEAQEKTQHSSAVQVEQVSALLRSQGTNPQTLFDENGQQFQRPYFNPNFVERKVLWEKMTQHFAQSEQQILILTAHGLGGMGKTELAGYYYLHPPRPYTLRAWFNANSKDDIYLQYIELAASNGFQFLESMPIEDKVRRVKAWLESQKDCLLVYDNLPALHVVEELLPERGKHHILMTSRNSVGFTKHQTFDVDVMEEGEAIALIVKITGFQEDNEGFRQLVNTLGRLPLALAQAGAYLAETQTSIEDYLKLYQKHQAELLKNDTLERNPRHEPVWVTFDMNFKALETECPAALSTLKQASWLNFVAIPEILLQSMMNQDSNISLELLWPKIKKYIGRYSLMKIDIDGHQLSIHPLLKDILRNKQEAIEQARIFKFVCEKTHEEFNRKTLHVEDEARQKALLPHIQSLLSYGELFWFDSSFWCNKNLAGFVDLLIDAKSIFHDYIDDLKTKKLDYRRALKNQKRDLSLVVKILTGFNSKVLDTNEEILLERANKALISESENRLKIVKILRKLAIVYGSLGDLKRKKMLLENALTFFQGTYSREENLEKIIILIEFADIYKAKKNRSKGEPILRAIEEILQLDPNENRPEMAQALHELGILYGSSRLCHNTEKKKQFLKHALNVKKAYYGEAHAEVAKTLMSLANAYGTLGKSEKREKLLRDALNILEKNYHRDYREVADILMTLGNPDHVIEGGAKKKKEFLERALKINEQHYGKNSLTLIRMLDRLSDICEELEEFEESKEYLDQILNIQSHFDEETEVKEVLSKLKHIEELIREKNENQAKDFHVTLAATQEFASATEEPPAIITLKSDIHRFSDQGMQHYRSQEYKEAIEFFQQALSLQQQVSNPCQEEVERLRFNLGFVCLLQYQRVIQRNTTLNERASENRAEYSASIESRVRPRDCSTSNNAESNVKDELPSKRHKS